MTVYPTDHAGLEILPFEACLRLLDSVPVGRVGFFTDGEVVILPVNYLVDGQDVIFRTGAGSKLSYVRGEKLISFEADSYDTGTHSGWSVVVSGRSEEVESDGEIHRLSDLGLQSWGRVGDSQHWIRIRPTSITGRRTAGAAFGGLGCFTTGTTSNPARNNHRNQPSSAGLSLDRETFSLV